MDARRVTLAICLAAATVGPNAGRAMGESEWDADGDGLLNPGEFAAGFVPLGTYRRFDVDGSGGLDAMEWEAGLTELGEYANMDIDGNGAVDEIEYIALLFNRYDSDGSGRIAEDEMDAVEEDLTDGMLAP
jgi:hypothetical protein